MPLRILKQLPGMPTESGERHAGWLELFFDLVFVLAVGELARYLYEHLTLAGLLAFAGLFVVVWWAWLSFTFFADQFDPDHVAYRLVMLAVMLCSIMLAVNIDDAFSEHASAFILLYTVLQALLTCLYMWGRRDEQGRTLATRFSIGFAIATALWLTSLWMPALARYIIWGLALLIEIGTPLLVALTLKVRPFYISHIPERLGLFTIIVLGEAVIRIGTGLVGTRWQFDSAVTAVASFIIAASLWWLYFDRIDVGAIQRSLTEQPDHKRELLRSFTWSYAHVIIFAGLAATSVGITLTIEEAGRQLQSGTSLTLGLGCATTLLAITFIHHIGPLPPRLSELITRLGMIGLIVVLAFTGIWLGSAAVTGLLALLLVLVTVTEAVFFNRQGEETEQSGQTVI